MAVKFSILVVCLNPGAKLAETVESIRKQEYRDYEIIVKDGGSKDGSVGLLPADEKIRLIEKKDTGIYDAMNQAVSEAAGEYVLFLNCGDLFRSLQEPRRPWKKIPERAFTTAIPIAEKRTVCRRRRGA